MNNIQKLPDSYNKKPNSNNAKLLQLQELAMADVRKELQDIEDCLDLNQAYGKTLDLYGEMEEQKRGLLNDEQYRYMILLKIGIDNIQGDYNNIMRVIVQIFNCKNGQIKLDDIEVTETSRSCVVKLTKFPVQVLIDAGFSSKQAVQMIEKLLPIGVSLAADNFDGTFAFAETEQEYDETAGFANETQTIGGYFGLLLGEDDTIPILPI